MKLSNETIVRLITWGIISIGCIAMILFFCSCKIDTSSLENKAVNVSAYGGFIECLPIDPVTGMPGYNFRIMAVGMDINTVPIKKGQPFVLRKINYSIWPFASHPASEITIWIGRATEDGVLKYKDTGGMIIEVSKDFISLGNTDVTLTPAMISPDSGKAE